MTYFPHDELDVLEPEALTLLQVAEPLATPVTYAFRRSMGAIETALAVAAAVGAVQLAADLATPPDSQLPFGLHTWMLPAIWLFVTVCAPCAAAAVALARRASRGPALVLAASALLGVELLVQLPFVGVNWLQLVVAVVGATAAAMAFVARKRMH